MKNLELLDTHRNEFVNNVDEIYNRMKYVADEIAKIQELIQADEDPQIIKTSYKDLEEWLKKEHKILNRPELNPQSILIKWYSPLISDVYVKAFHEAKSSSPVPVIQEAINYAQSECSYWVENIENWRIEQE